MTFVGGRLSLDNHDPTSDQIILLHVLPLLYIVQRQATFVPVHTGDIIIRDTTCLFFDLPSLFSWKRTPYLRR